MDLKALQEKLRNFASDRAWGRFHTPKNLSMALMVESAELMEIFQWMTPEESLAVSADDGLQVHVGEELADILLYLVQLADHTGVDLEQAVGDKLIKNALKHVVPATEVVATQVESKPSQTHVLVDWENVQPKEADIRGLVPDVTNVWIFHGPNQRRVGDSHLNFGDALTLVPISRAGRNALDFHLSYYVGYISSRNPNAKFIVISNDQGYGPMLEHAIELGFAASQVGFGEPRSPAKMAPLVKATAKKAPAKKAASVKPVGKSVTPAKQPKLVKVIEAPSAKNKPKTTKAVVVQGVSGLHAAMKTQNAATLAKEPLLAKSATGDSQTVATTAAKGAEAVASGKQKALLADADRAYAHVLGSLRKSKTKPRRRAGLYGVVKSLLGVDTADDAGVERVVARLVTDGHLAIDSSGAVLKTP